VITVKGVSKAFGQHRVLRGVDLHIRTGETLVILGTSGGGKSVLLKVIAGLLTPDEGSVVIHGQDRRTQTREEAENLALSFGYLFQGAALFDSLSVGENITFALRRYSGKSQDELRAIADERLSWVGLKGIQDKKPAELSGGMRKRVGLARAVAMDPAIILYDEPTTGLDPISSDAINDLILSLQERLKLTSIVVTHDMASAFKVADRMALLYQGQIVAMDDKEAFRNSPNEVVQQFINGRAQGPIQFL
jgi:phospholipid/cholesterol/gamma-HCH transport system ATP-binding protein